jgi:glucose-1-phosphatase
MQQVARDAFRPLRPRLVCFDLGGVVIRICRSWEEGCRAAGVPWRAEPAWVGELETISQRYHAGLSDTLAFARELHAATDGIYSVAEILAIHHAWLLEPYEGVAELVEEAHAAGLASAVLSNTNAAHWGRLCALPALMHIGQLFASHEIHLLKPDTAAFAHVEQASGCAGPDILFFDDTLVNVEAACSRGWQAVLIDHEQPTAPQMRQALVRALR